MSQFWAEKEPRLGSQVSYSTRLVLHNRGPAIAEEVDLELSGQGWNVLKDMASLPVSLDADQKYAVTFFTTADGEPTAEVALTWRDGTGPRAKTLTLSYP